MQEDAFIYIQKADSSIAGDFTNLFNGMAGFNTAKLFEASSRTYQNLKAVNQKDR